MGVHQQPPLPLPPTQPCEQPRTFKEKIRKKKNKKKIEKKIIQANGQTRWLPTPSYPSQTSKWQGLPRRGRAGAGIGAEARGWRRRGVQGAGAPQPAPPGPSCSFRREQKFCLIFIGRFQITGEKRNLGEGRGLSRAPRASETRERKGERSIFGHHPHGAVLQ